MIKKIRLIFKKVIKLFEYKKTMKNIEINPKFY